MTTKVAIAAQYASGICTSRAMVTDTVAATAVRVACAIEGRFFLSQGRSFMEETIFVADLSWQGHNLYLQRGNGNQLLRGTAKSHACAIAIGSLGRVSSGHE